MHQLMQQLLKQFSRAEPLPKRAIYDSGGLSILNDLYVILLSISQLVALEDI